MRPKTEPGLQKGAGMNKLAAITKQKTMRQITITILTIFTTIIAIGQDATTYKVALNKELSSPYYDFAPMFVDNNFQSMIFSSARHDTKSKEPHYNFFYTTIKKGKWKKPVAFDTLSKASNNAVMSIDKKRNVLFFTKCPIQKNMDCGCDIYYAFMQGALIGESIKLGIETPKNQKVNIIGHPFFSNELDVMLFTACGWPGGYGGCDIWYSIYNRAEDTWGKPQNLGPEVNTDKDEEFPYLHVDGTLYFVSYGHGSLGGKDIFKAKQNGKLSWSNVENMGVPINSNADDFAIIFRGATNSGYFSSNRQGGLGEDDIYEFSATDITPSSIADTATVDTQEVQALSAIFNKEECTANKESLEISQVKSYPNPNNGEFTFEFKCNMKTDLTIRIYSNLGRLVSTETASATKGLFSKQYNLTTGAGIYYIQILYNCETLKTEKVIVK